MGIYGIGQGFYDMIWLWVFDGMDFQAGQRERFFDWTCMEKMYPRTIRNKCGAGWTPLIRLAGITNRA
jgi:hypothetical protein